MKTLNWIVFIGGILGTTMFGADPEPTSADPIAPQTDPSPITPDILENPLRPNTPEPVDPNEDTLAQANLELQKAYATDTPMNDGATSLQSPTNLNVSTDPSEASARHDETTASAESEEPDLSGSEATEPEPELTLSDLRPAVKLPHTWVFYTIWGILGLLLLLVLWMIRRSLRQPPATVIELSPYAQAIKDLEKAQSLMTRNDIKPFITAITDVIRTYFERGFSLPAPEYTTEELLEELKGIKILSDEDQQLIADFFQQCDLAKFTQQMAKHVEGSQLYNQAKTILQCADKYLHPEESATPSEGESDANTRV